MENKKSKYLVIIIICIVTLFLYFKGENLFSNKKIDPTNFAVENTENISKVIMSDKKGDKIIMEKKDDQWFINNKYKIWDIRIDYLLEVLKDIKVKSSVPLKRQNTVIKNIATTGVKIEIFENNNLTKTYFIGGNTSDHLGTYMIMKGAEEAYIIYMPNRNPGILNPKYGIETNYVNEQLWREPITISIDGNTISEIEVINLQDEKQSFVLTNKGNEIFLTSNGENINYNQTVMNDFIHSFVKLQCGTYKTNLDINNLNIDRKIIIHHEKGIDTLTIFQIKEAYKNTKESESNVLISFAKWNNSDLAIIQKNIFNKVLITLDEIKQ